MTKDTLLQILHSIPADQVSEYDWARIGMALKLEGCNCDDWDAWSATDTSYGSDGKPRYHPGECRRLWNSFRRDSGCTGGTIVWIAKQYNDDVMSATHTETTYIDAASYLRTFSANPQPLDPIDNMLQAPHKSPEDQLMEYISTLYQPGDTIAYVTSAHLKSDGKWEPDRASYTTYESIIKRLEEGDSVEAVLRGYNKAAGVWICMNPMDYGQTKKSVEAYRYALIECDKSTTKEQIKTYMDLQLPIATLTYSGGKSVHAVVRIDAYSPEEYAKRVRFLHTYVKGYGLDVDEANKNPNRLTRMPGVCRGEQEQWLIATDIGAEDYADWVFRITGLE